MTRPFSLGWTRLVILLILFPGFFGASIDHAKFYGGTMSFVVNKAEQGYQATIKIWTAWKIGYGPCGNNCTYDDIGRTTSVYKQNLLQQHGDNYFGTWTQERQVFSQKGNVRPTYYDLTPLVTNNITETVQNVNEKLQWEMEHGEFTVFIQNDTDYIDIKFDGMYWTETTLKQRREDITPPFTNISWFLQTKIRTAVRSDTQRSNNSPVLLMKPYYRLVIGKNNRFNLTYIDPDNDIVVCEEPSVGTNRGVRNPRGFKITDDCKIEYFVDRRTYKHHDTGIILVDVMDYNKNDMVLGIGENGQIYPGKNLRSRSLSHVPYQFYFEVVDHIESPEFIDPTPKHNQIFEIYVGAELNVLFIARPTNPDLNVSIQRFFFVGLDGKANKIVGAVIEFPHIDPRAKGQRIKWVPKLSDIGSHALCSNVIDSFGEEAFSLYCLIIIVKEFPFKQIRRLVGQPYFLHFPSDGDLTCQVDSICKFPIYAKTDDIGGIVNITVTGSNVAWLYVDGRITGAPNLIDKNASMVEISFQDPIHGQKKFCVKASDNHKSTIQCLYVFIEFLDPCLSSPCHNSGECISKGDGTYQCVCNLGTTGHRCDIRLDRCKDVDCKHGGTCYSGYCDCVPGTTGMYCETAVSVCSNKICSQHGMCVDRPGLQPDHVCYCTDFYTGSNCSIPPNSNNCTLFPNHPECNKCASNSCNTGRCLKTINGHKCICPEGFLGRHCESRIDTTRTKSTGVFVSPTLPSGAIITCDPMSTGIANNLQCNFPVFVYWNNITGSVKPVVEPTYISDGLTLDRYARVLLRYLNKFPVAGFDNTYMANVEITGLSNLPFKIGNYIVCFAVEQADVQTDQRCFNLKVEPQAFNMHKGPIDRRFEFATLPERSVIVCVKNTTCYINVYTTYTSNTCVTPVTANTAPGVIFGPEKIITIRKHIYCHFTVGYITDNLQLGTEQEFCLKASQTGESRCFLIHVIERNLDSCLQNPCKNKGLCNSYGNGTYTCICQKGFSGINCETGPCTELNGSQHCVNDGHCHTNGTSMTCYCRLGTTGSRCEVNIGSSRTVEARFSGSSVPSLIECHLGEDCQIPSVLTSNAIQKPIVSKGFVSSGLQVNGITITQDKNNTYMYHVVTTVSSINTGLFKSCIQTLNLMKENVDEVCYRVNVFISPGKAVSQRRPHFIPPTLPNDSYITCTVGRTCHQMLWIKNYDFSCPEVIPDQTANDGMYVFQAEKHQSPCLADVSIHTDTEKTFQSCFLLTTNVRLQYGGDGEKRCFHIEITKNLAHGPCSSLQCKNGGFCNGKEDIGFCQCPSGYSGATCELGQGISVTSSESKSKPVFGDNAIPKNIVCVLHDACSVGFTVSSKTRPVISADTTSHGLRIINITTSEHATSPGTYMASLSLVGISVGLHKTCVKAGRYTGNVNDEICFTVEVTDSILKSVSTTQPHFVEPSTPEGSVLQCVIGIACHILFFKSGGGFPECPSMQQTQGQSDEIHIFSQGNSSNVSSDCIEDILLMPSQSATGKHKLCFELFLPSVPGETRCFYVEYLPYTRPFPIFPLNCVDHEDQFFSCREWNVSLGICQADYQPVHKLAVQRCPKFCNYCSAGHTVLPTQQTTGCQNFPTVDCLTLQVTGICQNSFGRNYCKKFCNLCSTGIFLTLGPDLNGK